MANMTATELVRYAFQCAIRDRESYADCWSADAPERKEAMDEVRQFKAYMRRRFDAGLSRLDAMALGGKLLTLNELRAITPERKSAATPKDDGAL